MRSHEAAKGSWEEGITQKEEEEVEREREEEEGEEEGVKYGDLEEVYRINIRNQDSAIERFSHKKNTEG